MNEESQRSVLMAQFDKKRAMRQKYLRRPSPQDSPLTALVLRNAVLLAAARGADVFSLLRRFQQEGACGETTFTDAMDVLNALAEAVDASPYELLVEDGAKQKKLVSRLLESLKGCDDWVDMEVQDGGDATFSLLGFDYALRLSERPMGILVFRRQNGLCALTAKYAAEGYLPGQIILWQEREGSLADFMVQAISDLESGWPMLKTQFAEVREAIAQETETLRDLSALLAETPMDPTPLLRKTAQRLVELRNREQTLCASLPQKTDRRHENSRNTQLLLAAAAARLDQPYNAETLSEAVCLLEGAAQPL